MLLKLHNGGEIEVLVFVFGIVYCTKVRHETIQGLNKGWLK